MLPQCRAKTQRAWSTSPRCTCVRQAFFADIYVEALNATPARGHRALAGIAAVGKLRREYTLNIDGLHNAVGLTTWHPEKNPDGEDAARLKSHAPAAQSWTVLPQALPCTLLDVVGGYHRRDDRRPVPDIDQKP